MGSYSHLLCVALLCACSGPASTAVDAAQPDAGCAGGVECATWIEDYQREIVSKLSGESAIAEQLTIDSRFTLAERNAVRDYLSAELARYGLEPVRHSYGTGTNIIARLPATRDGASLILLGSHFDGIDNSPAAGDNATGVALVLAAARYFQEQEQRDNDMIFAFFDEEERGLLGSSAYAAKLRSEEPDLAAAHIFDLVSWDVDGDGAVEIWSPSPELESLYRGVGDELGVPVQPVDFDSSDHAAFIGNGFSSVGVSEEFVAGDFNPNYHTPQDSYANIDFDYLAYVSRFVFQVTARAQ